MLKHTIKAIYALTFLLGLLCLTIALQVTVSAVPAFPGAQTINQADGSRITIYQYGDEYLNWIEDGNRNLIVLGKDGNFYLANWTNNGPVATTQRVPSQNSLMPIKDGTPAPVTEAKHNIPQTIIDKARNDRMENEKNKKPSQNGLLSSSANPVTARSIPVLVIYAIPSDYNSNPKIKSDIIPTSEIKQKIFDKSSTALSLEN